jgi:hypothetical protein
MDVAIVAVVVLVVSVIFTTLSVCWIKSRWIVQLMNEKFKAIWKEVVLTQFKVLSKHFPGGSEENRRRPQ